MPPRADGKTAGDANVANVGVAAFGNQPTCQLMGGLGIIHPDDIDRRVGNMLTQDRNRRAGLAPKCFNIIIGQVIGHHNDAINRTADDRLAKEQLIFAQVIGIGDQHIVTM